MTNITLRKLVAFAVLMESGDGIRTKSPDYIAEKWHLATESPDDLLPTLMDVLNRAKYYDYLRTWKI